MEMIQDDVSIYCLPDGACCEADNDHRSPLELDECPMGHEVCTGMCEHYAE